MSSTPADSSRNSPFFGQRLLGLANIEALDNLYAMRTFGACREPEIRELIFDRCEAYKHGDIVILRHRPKAVRRAIRSPRDAAGHDAAGQVPLSRASRLRDQGARRRAAYVATIPSITDFGYKLSLAFIRALATELTAAWAKHGVYWTKADLGACYIDRKLSILKVARRSEQRCEHLCH
jgi:hypothetical protein